VSAKIYTLLKDDPLQSGYELLKKTSKHNERCGERRICCLPWVSNTF